MEFSPLGIAQLAAALALAQAEIRSASKDSDNPHFRSKYADLASVWDACRSALSKHGLSVVQTIATADRNVLVSTALLHKSGEWIRDAMTLQAKDTTAHSVGSCATYGRRFSLAAFVGVAPADETDDDGNAASLPPQRQATPPPAAPVARPAAPPVKSADELLARYSSMRAQLVKLFGDQRVRTLMKEWTDECGKDREAILAKMSEAVAEEHRAPLDAV